MDIPEYYGRTDCPELRLRGHRTAESPALITSWIIKYNRLRDIRSTVRIAVVPGANWTIVTRSAISRSEFKRW